MDVTVVSGVGAEKGLGAQLSIRFAQEGMHILVSGRTKAKLDHVVELIQKRGGSAEAIVADATDESKTVELFETAKARGNLKLAIYNTGNNTPGKIVDMEASYFEESWRVCCFGGFLFAREALKQFQSSKDGVLLFTGASASLRGRPNFGAFNSSKGALRNLAQAIAKEYGPEGVHVGHVVVDGPIGGEKIISRFPEYAEKLGKEGMISIEGIVDAFVYLYRQPKNAWTFEVDVRTSIEKW